MDSQKTWLWQQQQSCYNQKVQVLIYMHLKRKTLTELSRIKIYFVKEDREHFTLENSLPKPKLILN